jgi:hypothetical protein
MSHAGRSLVKLIATFAACALVPIAAAVPAPKPATAVPMRPYGTQPAVHVFVNGRGPYLFLVDTGASGLARIDASVAKELALPDRGNESASGATRGAPVAIRRVAVASLRVGDREYRNLEPLSRSYNVPGEYVPDIGGILALNLFEGQLLTIDFPRNEIRVEEGALPPADGRTILDYEEKGGLVHLPIAIQGLKLTALVDTGTDRAIDLPTSVVRQLRLADFPRGAGKAAGVTGEVAIAETRIAGDLLIGEHGVERPEATFSEAFQFPILGSVFLHDFALTIDQKNKRIRLVRASGPRRPKP